MSFPWQPAPEEMLRALFAAGKSSGLIAGQLSNEFGLAYTRNAVIGKLNRLGLSVKVRGPTTTVVEKPARIVRTHAHVERRGGINRTRVVPFAPVIRPEPEPVIDDSGAPRTDLLTLFDLTQKSCRWPYGDGPFLFCGHKVFDPTVPYCLGHAGQAFVKPMPRAGARPFRRAA